MGSLIPEKYIRVILQFVDKHVICLLENLYSWLIHGWFVSIVFTTRLDLRPQTRRKFHSLWLNSLHIQLKPCAPCQFFGIGTMTSFFTSLGNTKMLRSPISEALIQIQHQSPIGVFHSLKIGPIIRCSHPLDGRFLTVSHKFHTSSSTSTF